MNKERLIKILQNVTNLPVTDEFIERLYEPEYYTQPIDEYKLKTHFKKAIVFDWEGFGFIFKNAEISRTGFKIELQSEKIEKLSISVNFKAFRDYTIINHVIFSPKFTQNDFDKRGGKIYQKGKTIKNNSDFKRALKDTFERFDCPKITKCKCTDKQWCSECYVYKKGFLLKIK